MVEASLQQQQQLVRLLPRLCGKSLVSPYLLFCWGVISKLSYRFSALKQLSSVAVR